MCSSVALFCGSSWDVEVTYAARGWHGAHKSGSGVLSALIIGLLVGPSVPAYSA